MSRGVVTVLILQLALVLAGCSGPPELDRPRVTDTDRQRVQVMLDEQIIRNAMKDVSPQPGTLLAEGSWSRGSVAASIFSVYPDEGGGPASPELTERRTAESMGVLRDTGWTIMSASCDVPEPGGSGASAPPSPDPGAGSYSPLRWALTAYKHVDGVSYWANLTAGAVPSGPGFIDLTMRAPNADDPADLFADRPAGLPADSTCIEKPGIVAEDVAQGSPIYLAQRGPSPPEGANPAR
ncbi:MAG: hypothetical protein GEV09_21300 [Pseudonocardiaceae bacterium]|nr:hypothetical protein [Pseudonocardiaceae bacterium]